MKEVCRRMCVRYLESEILMTDGKVETEICKTSR